VTAATPPFAKAELAEALRAIVSTVSKCEQVQPKLRPGTAQHTLLVRRIKALQIAAALIERDLASTGRRRDDGRVTFRAKLFRYPGAGGWTFAKVPARHAPPATHAWGRTPVLATVDGVSWATSVWRDKKHGTLLAVPKKVRGDKGDGDVVQVELRPRG